jgi:CheY-like chemotaxis protein
MGADTSKCVALSEEYARLRLRTEEELVGISGVVPRIEEATETALREIRARIDSEYKESLSLAVLIVEDDAAQRELLCELLQRKLRVRVDGAADADEAEQKWRRTRHGVVLADVFLGPGKKTGDKFLQGLPRAVQGMVMSGAIRGRSLVRAGAMSGAMTREKPMEEIVKDVKELLQKAMALGVVATRER